jgi:Ca2+-binding RTX toxin-like protein
MAINVSNSTQLRTAIQNVTSLDPLINLADANYTTITTLAKLPSYPSEPAVPFINGYTIDGTSQIGTVINDTRIYQQNIDGLYAPSTVKDLTLQYNSLTNNTAILRATSGTYSLDNLLITGQHSGWAGNGGVYISMTVSDGNTPILADLTLSNSTISVSGQTGNAAFFQSWNNEGSVNLNNNDFDEAGLNAGSFHFASLYPDGASSTRHGAYTISDNTFTRLSGPTTPNTRGNRLESVEANVYGNTFSNGSYLNLYGDLGGVAIAASLGSANTFNTVYGGSGITVNKTSSSGATLNTTGLQVTGNYFTGYGLALVNNDNANNSLIKVGANKIKTGNFASMSFTTLCAGGSGSNTVTGGQFADWISGGGGSDTLSGAGGADYLIGGADVDSLTGGSGADTFVYYESTEGQDTITDFTTAVDCLAFRGNTSGGSSFFNFAPGATLTLGTNFITSGSVATNAVPTFIYFGGVLSYDADGTGGGAAVNIATLATSPTLAASDIKFF